MNRQRRAFLVKAAHLAAWSALGAGLSGSGAGATVVALGVASGSPLPDAVVLWTRILYDPLDAAAMPPLVLAVRWEVAADEAFTRIVASGMASATPELAHSVHVDVTGLAPGRWYWYRFIFGDAVSQVGRTRTAPAPATLPAALKLAVASCQHWEFGAY
ncbi:MAG: PhoD-like phosphatase N-terminal domain-containing protein, partial [Burkholderiaceae bacterium]|nr:PhoD-like phosphatase N-terminal domain-containing protein [Burkholderiaceae bacterium]